MKGYSQTARGRGAAASACSAGWRTRSGQSLIETCVVVALIGLLFMGLFQVSLVFAARDVLQHAAARAARARTVGLNRWMVEKAARVAAIPNAGDMVHPEFDIVDVPLRQLLGDASHPGQLWDRAVAETPVSPQYEIERARIPEYMASPNEAQAHHVLDYAGWDSVRVGLSALSVLPGDRLAIDASVRARAEQEYPLVAPLHRAFYGADRVRLSGDSEIENHYPLYLDDRDW